MIPRAAAALACALGAALAQGQSEPRVQRIVIVERGIYQTKEHGPLPTAASLRTGDAPALAEAKLLKATTEIPAKKGVHFGFKYRLVGEPKGGVVRLKVVTRFPKGGLRDPETRETYKHTASLVTETLGGVRYEGYAFDKPWELKPGRWVFEIWQDKRRLGAQEFTVVAARD